jgi:hypothetical protein
VIFSFDDDDDDNNAELCTMIVSLMQEGTRQRVVKEEKDNIYIVFYVFKVSIYIHIKKLIS